MHLTLHSSESVYSQQSFTLSSRGAQGNEDQNGSVKATDRVLDQLAEKIPGMSGGELKALKADEFTPDKVSGRIADYVAMGLERAKREGKSDAELQSIYDASVKGIEQGFREATEILEQMNLLSEDLSSTIDETLSLTLSKVSEYAPSATTSPITAPSTSSISAAERYESAESFSLKVRTQDGDNVTIRFANTESYESSLGYFSNGEGTSATAFSIDRSQKSSFQFSVTGDLDDDEISALQNLIQEINLIADDFFDGDVQAAFEQASEFEMDKTELASMRLTLKRSEEYSTVSAYQQVQGYDQTALNQAGERKLGHMINGLQEQMSQSKVAFVESVTSFSMKLFDSLIQQDARYKDSNGDSQSRITENLARLHELIEPSKTEA